MEQDSMYFARDAVFTGDPEKTGLNSNAIVVGASGSGKTMSVIAPRLLHSANDSMIVTVAKRSLVRKYSALLRKRGYRVLDLNLADPADGSSCSFDPMKYCSSSSQDLMYLANSILLSNPRKEHSAADPYWDDMAAMVLTAVMELERAENPNASIVDVVETVLYFDLLPSSTVSVCFSSTLLITNFELYAPIKADGFSQTTSFFCACPAIATRASRAAMMICFILFLFFSFLICCKVTTFSSIMVL